MTNLLAFSSDKIFTVSQKKTLLAIDQNGQLLYSKQFEQTISAITVDSSKNNIAVGVKKEGEGKKPNLFAFSIKNDSLEEFLAFELPHEAIQLLFSDYNSKYSLLALNSGDIDCIDIETKTSKTLLGSIATGTAFIIGSNILISSDRDARIRYSRFPQTYEILAFGFHHEEFISSIDFLDENHIVSGDGDGQIIKWDLNGHTTNIKQLSEAGTIIRKLVSSNSLLYAIIENDKTLYIINQDSLDIINKVNLNEAPLTIAQNTKGQIFVLTVAELYELDKDKNELKPLHKIELSEEDASTYSLENQRVKCKKIIHRKDKGTEDYEIWRNPEKSPSRDD